jgi:hypothetical protein
VFTYFGLTNTKNSDLLHIASFDNF